MGFVFGVFLVVLALFGIVIIATLNGGGDIISCALAGVFFLVLLALIISLVNCVAALS